MVSAKLQSQVFDEILGFAVKAFVVLKEGVDLTVEQIMDFCRQKLEHSRIPKEIEFRDSLPKSSSGKVCKGN